MRRITSLLIASLITVGLYANPVSTNTAQTVASNFYSEHSNNTIVTVTLAYTANSASNTALYYIFNINQNNGFVIVSADNNASPVIGYSTKGTFSVNNQAPEFIYWMQHYAKELNYIEQNNIQATAAIQTTWNNYINNIHTPNVAPSVSPLIQTTWNQYPYYNDLCPGGSVTGCVATAMSQIMRYWNYPAHGIGSSCYSDMQPQYSENYGTLCANYGSTVYNWSNMPLSISASNLDVATLCYDAGVSVDMDYSPSGSGSWVIRQDDTICAQTSYYKYFGYNQATITGNYRSTFADTTWVRMLETELTDSRPVQYAGFGNQGGHTWVCDGYDNLGNFDMNWGWGGSDNGYYALNALNPGGIPFDSTEEAVMGIEPMPIKALMSGNPLTGCAGTTVNFTDQSLVPSVSSPITAWQWSFPGGNPSSSTSQNPTVTYNTPGNYNVSLTVTNINGSNSVTMNSYVTITTPNTLPLVQGFEGSFPPPQWSINNPNNHSTTWAQYIGIGGYGNSNNCIYYNNCSGGIIGEYDQIYTPVYDFTQITNPRLYFDVAYTPYNATYSDTLAIYYSTDCGVTFNIIYLKGGMTLSTTGGTTVQGGANNSGGCFIPLNNNWRTDTISIPAIAGQSSVLFSFENRSGNGTDMYIDNINIPGLPGHPLGIANISEDNSLTIYPNPNDGTFQLSFSTQQDATYDISIYNVLGQQVLHNVVQNSSNTYTHSFDMSQFSKGIYTVILRSGDQQTVKKIAIY